jgi:hypothetical protein
MFIASVPFHSAIKGAEHMTRTMDTIKNVRIAQFREFSID